MDYSAKRYWVYIFAQGEVQAEQVDRLQELESWVAVAGEVGLAGCRAS